MAEQTVLIGRRIAQARDDLKLTQAELAAELPGKADGTQVSKWERGVHRPSDDTLEHIARILKRDVAWFLIPDPDKARTPDLTHTLSVPSNRELADLAVRLTRIETLLAEIRATQMERELTEAAAAARKEMERAERGKGARGRRPRGPGGDVG